MASSASVRLPPVGRQLQPALAWAEAPSAAPAPRPPSTPRVARGRPVPGVLTPGRIRRPLGLRLPGPPAASALHDDLPERKRLLGAPRWHVAGALTAPELGSMELVEAMSGQTCDTESASDLSEESPRSSKPGAGRHRTGQVAREDQRPFSRSGRVRPSGEPCQLEEDRRPDRPRRPQAQRVWATASAPGQRPPSLDDCGLDDRRSIPRCASPSPKAQKPASPPPPMRPRAEAPAQARPSHAGRALSARGSRRPRCE